jgi:large subunit ribosomal protein L11
VLICKEIGINGGSGVPNLTKVGKLTSDQVRKIAQIKMPDLNTDNIESAMLQIEGTARSMGVDIVRD